MPSDNSTLRNLKANVILLLLAVSLAIEDAYGHGPQDHSLELREGARTSGQIAYNVNKSFIVNGTWQMPKALFLT